MRFPVLSRRKDPSATLLLLQSVFDSLSLRSQSHTRQTCHKQRGQRIEAEMGQEWMAL